MAKPDRTWIRLAVDYDDDDAMCNISPLAELLFVRACARSKRNRDAGAVHARALGRLTVRMGLDPDSALALTQELVREGVWTEVDGGWRIAQWEKWQDADENPEAKSMRTSERNSAAAHIRWHDQGKHVEPHPECPSCDAHALRNADACERNADACPDTDTDTDADAYVSTTSVSPPSGLTPAPKVEAFESEFADWWQGYPKKVHKAKALKAYQARRREGIAADDLARAVEHYATERDGEPAEYTLHPATFLAKGGPWSERLDGPLSSELPAARTQGRPSQHERTVTTLDAWAKSFDDGDGEWQARVIAIDSGAA